MITSAKVTFFIIWYHTSAPCSIQLIKYTDTPISLLLRLTPHLRPLLILTCRLWSAAEYSVFCITGAARKAYNWRKISSYSGFQLIFAAFLKSWTIGLVFSANLGTNLDKVVNRPINLCIPLVFLGLRILMIALHFSGLASMLRWVSMNPKNLLPSTMNTHLSGFSHITCSLKALKTSCRSSTCRMHELDLTTMSSTYTSTFQPSILLKIWSINLC